MGWWIADRDSGGMAERKNASARDAASNTMWGDDPADAFDRAIEQIVERFTSELGRRPSKSELRAGLAFSLGAYQETEG